MPEGGSPDITRNPANLIHKLLALKAGCKVHSKTMAQIQTQEQNPHMQQVGAAQTLVWACLSVHKFILADPIFGTPKLFAFWLWAWNRLVKNPKGSHLPFGEIVHVDEHLSKYETVRPARPRPNEKYGFNFL